MNDKTIVCNRQVVVIIVVIIVVVVSGRSLWFYFVVFFFAGNNYGCEGNYKIKYFFILYKFMTKITLGVFCLNRKKVVFRPFESREPSWLRRIFCLNLDFFYAITLPITNSHRAVFSVN